MNKGPRYLLFLFPLLLAGCGTPREAHIDWSPPPAAPPSGAESPIRMYRIIDHKAQATGGDIPSWLLRYDTGGKAAQIEQLPGYQGKYIFIAENSGTNRTILEQWDAGFRVSLDFAGLLVPRILDRFTKEARTFPEQDFGAYYEGVIKTAYDTTYSGAVKEDDFWVQKQYVTDDGITPDQEVYTFYILVSVPQTVLQEQIQTILDTATPQRPLTKVQRTAVDQIKADFFTNF